MKTINLPYYRTFAQVVDKQNLTDDKIKEIDGERTIQFGQIDLAEKDKLLETAKDNGGKILYSTTSLEKKLEDIIGIFFFGKNPVTIEKVKFFNNEFLKDSRLTFSFKKELVQKILNNSKLISGKDKNRIQKNLKGIMDWRNAFAHGTLHYNNISGCVIQYYSSGNQTLVLDDAYWDLVEKTFIETDSIADRIIQNLNKDKA